MSHAVVLTLGDLGRSPRMQYHARSLADMVEISRVTAIGYEGEKCMNVIRENAKIHEARMKPIDLGSFLRRIPLLHAILKGMGLLLSLLKLLWSLPHYDIVLIQNPPCLPALLACLIYSWLVNGSIICIDWHNLGFSMFEERLGPNALVVRVSKFLERILTRQTNYHLCVSRTMMNWLRQEFDLPRYQFCIDLSSSSCSSGSRMVEVKEEVEYKHEDDIPGYGGIAVVHDRPPAQFTPLHGDAITRHELLWKLNYCDNEVFPKLASPSSPSTSTKKTIQTYEKDDGTIALRSDGASILFSATSWTEDEDFSLLYDALLKLNKELSALQGIENPSSNMPPRILVVITGKGPQKEMYMEKFAKLERENLTHIAIRTPWLEPEDYPKMVATAALGICLHTSTSGLDLPMKVLDMFGSGIPVAAVNFNALSELVKHGENGVIFRSKFDDDDDVNGYNDLQTELIDLLLDLFRYQYFDKTTKSGKNKSKAKDECKLHKLKQNVRNEALDGKSRWEHNWNMKMSKLIKNMIFHHINRSSWFLFYIFLLLVFLVKCFYF